MLNFKLCSQAIGTISLIAALNVAVPATASERHNSQGQKAGVQVKGFTADPLTNGIEYLYLYRGDKKIGRLKRYHLTKYLPSKVWTDGMAQRMQLERAVGIEWTDEMTKPMRADPAKQITWIDKIKTVEHLVEPSEALTVEDLKAGEKLVVKAINYKDAEEASVTCPPIPASPANKTLTKVFILLKTNEHNDKDRTVYCEVYSE